MTYASLYLKTKPKPVVETLRDRYDDLLRQFNLLSKYIDNPLTPLESRTARIGEFKRLMERLNQTIAQIEKEGYLMTGQEITEGFNTNITSNKNI